MAQREFTGFAGVTLSAETFGDEDQPTVLLLPGAMQTRAEWRHVWAVTEVGPC